MPLYSQLIVALPGCSKESLVTMCRRHAKLILDNGGVVRGIENHGVRPLPARAKRYSDVIEIPYLWYSSLDRFPTSFSTCQEVSNWRWRKIFHQRKIYYSNIWCKPEVARRCRASFERRWRSSSLLHHQNQEQHRQVKRSIIQKSIFKNCANAPRIIVVKMSWKFSGKPFFWSL